ncbi:MAG: DUF1343 domain-containing protein [Pirellulales bacterium]
MRTHSAALLPTEGCSRFEWQAVTRRGVALFTALFTCLLAILVEAEGRGEPLPQCAPEQVGLDGTALGRIDALVAQALAEKKLPGCVVCIGRRGQIAWLKAYGQRQLEPEIRPMTTDTVFDMASLTKPLVTATSILQLVEQGRLSLQDKVARHLPDFAVQGKDVLTVHDLLIHQSGLIADNPLADYEQGPEEAWRRIQALPLTAPPGSKFIYSDVNFIVLGKLVERISGEPLDEYARRHILTPLGMHESGYRPAEELRQRAAPTEQREGRWIQGEVHDPRAWKLGGVAGHAGLFSTAEDTARYALALLATSRGTNDRILAPATLQVMTRGYRVSSGLRGLGWDKRTGYSINRGDLMSDAAFGHGGFTGTSLWIDPQLDLFVLFLSNRVHPHGKGLVNPLAGRIGSVAAAAIREPSTQAAPRRTAGTAVLTGIDVLRRDGFRSLAGQKVGLITNHTGRAQDGTSTVELLRDAPQVQLTALFSPEHGFAGELDISQVADSEDRATGLRVFSLYGKTRRPTAEMLNNVDTLVFDIQDIGTRFYTYLSTMGEAMRAAAEHRRRFVVLDRPNPLGGVMVSGPLLDAGRESFTAFHRLPVRHGMTAGELARLFRDENKLDLELEVIRCEGWERRHSWDDTGLVWINPSPNMRSLTQAWLYPGIGLLETTNLSVGRGTDSPFEWIGAPWLDGRALAARLRAREIPGVALVPVEFTPSASKFQNERCGGVRFLITDRQQFDPLRLGLEIALDLRRSYPEKWEAAAYGRLLGNEQVQQLVLGARPWDEVATAADAGLAEFLRRRSTVLLYE